MERVNNIPKRDDIKEYECPICRDLHYTFNELFLQYLQYFFYGNIPLKPHLCYNDYVYLLTIFKGK